jgi:hypothetical protein
MLSGQDVVAHYLVSEEFGAFPVLRKSVPGFTVFVDSLPDTPDNVISVSSNGLSRDNEKMMEGFSAAKPGIQIKVRASDRDTAYNKIQAIYEHLMPLSGVRVTVLTETYRIANFSISGTPAYVGVGIDDQRPSFVFDLYLTYRKV